MAQQPFDLGDAGKQTTSTTGTGPYSLDGAAVAPYVSLKAAIIAKTGDATGPWDIARFYVSDGVNKEECSGRLTAGTPDTLTRTVKRSTNGNAAVNWGAGVRDIWIAPSSQFLMTIPGMNEGSALTIAGGMVTPKYGQHTIDTEGAAGTDDLDGLVQTDFHEGARIFISPVSAARTINVRHNQAVAGKVLLRDSANLLLDATTKSLELKKVGATWVEVDRCGFDLDITGLTAETAPAVGDEIALRDVSVPGNRKMTLANFFKVLNALTAESAPAIDDEVLLYDLSGTAAEKITLANLFKVINGLTEDTSPDKANDFMVTYDASAAAAKKVKLSQLGAFTEYFESAPIGSLAVATTKVQAHGLSGKPKGTRIRFKCTTADGGWSVGDEPELASAPSISTADRNITVHSDATNVNVVFAASAITMLNKSTSASFLLTLSSWQIIIEAWR